MAEKKLANTRVVWVDGKAKVITKRVRKAKPYDPERKKWCPSCETWKLGKDFWRDRSAHDGCHGYCKRCGLEKEAERRKRKLAEMTPEQLVMFKAHRRRRDAIYTKATHRAMQVLLHEHPKRYKELVAIEMERVRPELDRLEEARRRAGAP